MSINLDNIINNFNSSVHKYDDIDTYACESSDDLRNYLSELDSRVDEQLTKILDVPNKDYNIENLIQIHEWDEYINKQIENIPNVVEDLTRAVKSGRRNSEDVSAIIKILGNEKIHLQKVVGELEYKESLIRDSMPELDRLARDKIISMNLTHMKVANKLIVQLMMDKVPFPEKEEYESFNPVITGHAILRALERVLELKTTLSDETKDIALRLEEKISPLLKELIIFQSTIEQVYSGYILLPELTDQLVQKCANMNIGESLLCPTGCLGHATCLLIEKTDEGLFRITHYNTGLGVDKHAGWGDGKHFQTHFVINDVPEDSVLNEDAWKIIIECKFDSENMDPTYKCLVEELGSGGSVAPPSKHKEDYQVQQESGSCATKMLMALLRHQIMQMTEGSLAEKEATYKLLKTQMFTVYHQDNIPLIDSVIQRNLPTILDKLAAETKMVEIADDDLDFRYAIDKFRFFGQMDDGILNLVNKCDEQNLTNMEKYAYLRELSSELAKLWFDFEEFPEDVYQGESFQLARAKLANYIEISKNQKVPWVLEKLSNESS